MTRATHRAALAGVGTTGSLVAAVVAVATIATSVVTFTAWPDAPAREPTPVLEMQHTITQRTASTGGAIALPGDGGLAPLGSSGASSAGRPGGAGAAEATPLGGQAVGAVQPLRGAPALAQAEPGRPSGEKSHASTGDPLRPVVDVTTKASDNLGSSVKDGGVAAGDAARTLSPVIGDAVNAISGATGEGLAKAGAALAQILGGLGGGGR